MLSDIPAYSGSAYVTVNDNMPFFKESDYTTTSYESYSPLDELGRCGVAEACVGLDLMPTEERGSIGSVKPTGWQIAKYDFVDGKYLYNRCHLIGYQLTAENANKQNLITGTRYLNVTGMRPLRIWWRTTFTKRGTMCSTGSHLFLRALTCWPAVY